MEHRRPDDRRARGPAGGLTNGERARAAGTADPGAAEDTHVAGPAPKPPVMDTPGPGAVPAPRSGPPEGPPKPPRLLDPAEAERFRDSWRAVQSAFVDDPAAAVRRADDLASDAVDALGRAIAAHRRTLSEGLGHADPESRERADTERLRVALRGYRDLLDRVIDS